MPLGPGASSDDVEAEDAACRIWMAAILKVICRGSGSILTGCSDLMGRSISSSIANSMLSASDSLISCATCKKNHNTALHGRTPKPALSVHATSFLPGGNYTSLPATASTTGSEALMSLILPVLVTPPMGEDPSTT